jgi:hypothetical protein
MNQKKGFTSIQDVLSGFGSDEEKQSLSGDEKQGLSLRFSRDKFISREFQKYGYDLAEELGDLKNKSLYIKLAKETPRALLENARNYIKDAHDVKNPTALFLWKLKKLREEKKLKKQKGR